MLKHLETTLMQHLDFFCNKIGSRPIGSQACHQAAEYIRQNFREANLEISEQSFDCPDWADLETYLELDGARLEAAANIYSPSCAVTSPVIAVCTVTELEQAELEGKLVILYGELSKEPLIPLNCPVYNTERDQKINRLLLDKKPAAVIAVNPQLDSLIGVIEDEDFKLPSVTVSARTGLKLLKNLDKPLRLSIMTESKPSNTSTIIGRKDGTSPAKIVICCHYDTKISTPGAWDNGAGTAAVLALAEIFSRNNTEAGLEFIAFTAEEYSALCDPLYAETSGAEMGNILFALNMDGIGQRLGAHNLAVFANSEAFREELDELMRKYPAVYWTDPWPQSNHSTFSWRGVPSLAICSAGANLHHTPDDTTEWMSGEKLAEVVTLVQEIVERFQAKPLEWFRPPQE